MANNLSSGPGPNLRRKNCRSAFGWKIFLIAAQQIVVLVLVSRLNRNAGVATDRRDGSPFHLPPEDVDGAPTPHDRPRIHASTDHDGAPTIAAPNVQLTLAGMSYSDNTTSDSAIDFLVDAACNHGIRSHILLRERDATTSLTKKIAALAHHGARPLPTDGVISRPECIQWIRISESPSEELLLNMTRSRIRDSMGDNPAESTTTINNPLDPGNRIARIKQSREYQRETLRGMLSGSKLRSRETASADDWKANAAIAVLDLDMFAYPSPSDLLETARRHILLPPKTTVGNPRTLSTPKEKLHEATRYHAICSNGIFVRVKDGNYYDVRYYDTYSTILLPDRWLYREPGSSSKPKRKGKKERSRPMNQSQTFRHILRRGGQKAGAYEPVPVRSCFGGLTLYRADVWLDAGCGYDSYHEDDAAFASWGYRHACEHVVFHECLRREMGEGSEDGSGGVSDGFDIAVKPDMTTLWHTT